MKTIRTLLRTALAAVSVCLLPAAHAEFQPNYDLAKDPGTAADAVDVLAYGAVSLDNFGRVMLAGDLNGDGVDDLIVGTGTARVLSPARSSAGMVYIWFGKGALAGKKDAAGVAGTAPDVKILGASANDSLGLSRALAVGDVNGDGVADVILGSSFADGPADGRGNAGEVYIVFGRKSPAPFPATLDLAVQGSNGADVTIYGASTGDGLTTSGALALGDVNGDGTADLLLGAVSGAGPAEGRGNAGEAYIIFGRKSPAPFPATLDLAVQGSTGADVTIYGAKAGDALTSGGALAVGDVNGDGTADLLLGAVGGDGPSGTRNSAGEAYIILGRKSPATFPATLDLSAQGSTGADVTIYGGRGSDILTSAKSMGVGDVNGDGIADLLLGANSGDGPLNGRSNAGNAYVLFGIFTSKPDIAVAQGSAVSDGGSVDFETVAMGSSSTKTFTITNPGTADLTSLAISKDGADAVDFTVSSLSATSIATGSDTVTFTVTFSPGSVGAKTAAIHIASNMTGGKNPYDITLTGTGSDTTPPETTITSSTPAANVTSATITFSGSDDVEVTNFEGQLDGTAYATVMSPVSLTGLSQGAHTYSVRAKDAAGNVDASPATVTWVVDTTPPVVMVPANITVPATGPSGAVVNFNVRASDLVDGPVTATATPASGSTFANGTTTVTVTAQDAASNTGSASFTVTVTPLTPIEAWRYTNFGSASNGGSGADSLDADGDSVTNLAEFAFGTLPNDNTSGPSVIDVAGGAITHRGAPTVQVMSTDSSFAYNALYGRRKDWASAGLTFTVQFSGDLSQWCNSTETPSVIADDGQIEAVTVPYPAFVGGKKAQFFRVVVAKTP